MPPNIKRRRSSGSSDEQNVYTRSEWDESERFRRQRWRQELRDEERNQWLERERESRRRQEPRGRDMNIGHPQAHSTAGRMPGRWQEPAGGSSRNPERGPFGESGSRAFSTKMFKVEQFPKLVKPTDQYHEWVYWLANFEMAAEKAGITDQKARAIDLSLHVGEEIRRIIIVKEMLPKESSVEPGYPFFDVLASKLEEHFKSLTDESVDVASFNSLKQGAKETALEFELRVRQVAKRANETNVAMIRTRYIEGLRDEAIKERAFIDGSTLQEVVRMATRKEAISQKQQAEFSPWEYDTRTPLAVSAIQRAGKDKSQHGRPQSNQGQFRQKPQGSQWQRQREFRGAGKSNGATNDERCRRCGVTEHRNRTCPAENAPCFGCGDIGHFRHMCTKQVRSIDHETEVQTEIFD